MTNGNFTQVTEFILTGVSECPDLQIPLFFVFLVIYGLTVTGNLSIITLTSVDSRLQTPMYFFLWNFSFLEISFTTTFTPRLLFSISTGNKSISFAGCFAECFFAIFLGATEFYLLAAMSYDRYVGICNPLLYPVVMLQRVCQVLVAMPYLYKIFESLLIAVKIFDWSFCGYNVIRHFYCDSLPLLTLLCSSTWEIELFILICSVFNLVSSFLIVLVSYILILKAILKMNTAQGRQKAFSTCGSHLAVVSLFYGSLMVMYVSPGLGHSARMQKVTTLFYAMVTPLFNPFIYSFRNKEIKAALRKLLGSFNIM